MPDVTMTEAELSQVVTTSVLVERERCATIVEALAKSQAHGGMFGRRAMEVLAEAAKEIREPSDPHA